MVLRKSPDEDSSKGRRRRRRVVRRVSTTNEVSSIKINHQYVSTGKRQTDSKPHNKRFKSHFYKRVSRYLLYAVISLIVLFFIWSNLRVEKISLDVGGDQYTKTIDSYLRRNPVANLKPLISTKKISDNMLSTYPEIADVVLDIPFIGNKINVNVIIRDDRLVLKTGDNYYMVDQNGFAYSKYNADKGFNNVVLLHDDTGVEYRADSTGQFVPASLVDFIQTINKKLKGIDAYKGQTFSYRVTDETRVLYAKPSKHKYEIKFQQDTSIEQQLSNLESALEHMKKKSITPGQYIDVRVNGTVYYK